MFDRRRQGKIRQDLSSCNQRPAMSLSMALTFFRPFASRTSAASGMRRGILVQLLFMAYANYYTLAKRMSRTLDTIVGDVTERVSGEEEGVPAIIVRAHR